MSLVIDNSILDNHIKRVLATNFSSVFESHEFYNFRCNVCGDSKSDPYVKTAYILRNKDPWVFYCHRAECLTSISASNWLKKYFPDDYRMFINDVMRNNKTPNKKTYKNIKTKRDTKEIDEKKETSFFRKATNFKDVVDYCEYRKIPKKVYSKWYYAIDGMYKGRIIIPFKNDKGKIYYYQGRKFNNKYGVKYLSRFGDHNSIYNYYLVDKNKPVVILEGPVDAIFVDNSVAVTGIKIKDNRLEKFKNKYYILDNDEAANKVAIKLLNKREYVFNWNKFLKKYKYLNTVKDVNDFIMYNTEGISVLTWDIIEPFFTNNPSDKIHFIIKKGK